VKGALLVALVALAAAAGCSDRSEGRPNPALGKPPDVKPGRGADGKSGALDAKGAPKR
jgi:hypothetical protein